MYNRHTHTQHTQTRGYGMKDYANKNWYKNLVFVRKNKRTNLKEKKEQPQQKIAALITIR